VGRCGTDPTAAVWVRSEAVVWPGMGVGCGVARAQADRMSRNMAARVKHGLGTCIPDSDTALGHTAL
jgi:hypothetical protein